MKREDEKTRRAAVLAVSLAWGWAVPLQADENVSYPDEPEPNASYMADVSPMVVGPDGGISQSGGVIYDELSGQCIRMDADAPLCDGPVTVPEVTVEGNPPAKDSKKPAKKKGSGSKKKGSKAKKDSKAPSKKEDQEKLEKAAEGSQPAAEVMDGSQEKPKEPDPVLANGGNGAVEKPQGDNGTVVTVLGDPSTQQASSLVPEPPRAEPTFPKQGGDDREKPGFWSSAGEVAKKGLVAGGQIGAIGGMMFFLWGVATFNPIMMLGGLLAGAAAVLIGGLAQAYL